MEETSLKETLNRVQNLAHAKCSNLTEKMSVYSEWAEHFDNDVTILRYSAPSWAVKMLCDVIENDVTMDKSCSVIDFAAGTGLVGKRLKESGFTGRVDAHDGCQEMLQLANGIYSRTFCCILSGDVTDLPNELTSRSYDVAIMCGALSPSQVEVDCLKFLLAAVRVCGYVIFTTRLNSSNLDYVTRLEAEIGKLERENSWKPVSKLRVDEFELATDENEKTTESQFIPGVVYCFQKL